MKCFLIIKRLILIAMAFILLEPMATAQSSKTYKYKFDAKDFQFVEKNGISQIKSNRHRLTLLTDTLKPSIPYLTTNILLPKDVNVCDVEYRTIEVSDLGSYSLPSNPQISINDGCFRMVETQHTPSEGIYPLSQIKNHTLNIMDGYKFVSISFTPFIYDVYTKKLSLINELNIIVNMQSTSSASAKGEVMREVVKNIIDNKDDIDKLYPKKEFNRVSTRDVYGNNEIDYLIITADSMKDSFEELKKWSVLKGLKTQIVGVDEIYSNFYNVTDDNQKSLAIKDYLYRYYDNGLKSVLLAGDHDIVPTKLCYGRVDNTSMGDVIKNDLPTDLFYSCFDATFNWNANGNNIYGELEDNIDLSPDIFVSRIPIRNKSEVNAYINKLLNYEKYTIQMDDYASKILFAGNRISSSYSSPKSDTHYRGDMLYETYVRPFKPVPYNYLYDTGSSFEDENYFTAEQFQSVLSKGFNIVHVDAHGDFNQWKADDYTGRVNYSTEYASVLQSPCLALVISSACFVSDFKENSTCLAEAFIRNPNNGNVAFIGNSDYGFSNALNISSFWINEEFLKIVYQNNMRHLGEIVSLIKSSCASSCNTYGVERWLIMVLNPMGDPNFELNLNGKQNLANTKIIMNEDEGCIIESGIDSCRITMFNDDCNGSLSLESYNNVDTCIFGQNGGIFKFCIMKEGYTPFISDENPVGSLFIQNFYFDEKNSFVAKNAFIGRNVVPEYEQAGVEINPGASFEIKNTGTVTIINDFECKNGGVFKISPQ